MDVIFYTICNWPEKLPYDNYSSHDFHEIGYVIQGDGAMELNERIYPLKSNSFCVIPKSISHREISGKKKLTIFYVGFMLENDELWSQLAATVFDLNNFDILSELRLMINEMKKESEFKDQIMSKLFEVLFLDLYRKLS